MQDLRACNYCRARKRKCDRESPRCSLCVHKNQRCRYTSQTRLVTPDESPRYMRSRQQSRSLETGDLASEFPSAYFLDHEVYLHHQLHLPTVCLRLEPSMLDSIASPATVSARYFTWVHLWMPIVSKNRWYSHHINPLASPRSDVKVLLFCMKLVMETPGLDFQDREPRTEDYLAVKQLFLQAEQRGALSLQLLQALLLLAIYEYAHAIYPAAYMTIAICARYGIALGIHQQRREEIESIAFSLEQLEERRRVWWAIVVLDRVISGETPSSPEPRPDDLLPVHDQAWDDGIIDESRRSTVSAPTSTNMGMLARLSQAAYLLGRVLRHKRNPTNDPQFDLEERNNLNRTLRALINLTYEEGATRFMPICPQTAICFSALVILNAGPLPRGGVTDAWHHPTMMPAFTWKEASDDRNSDAVFETLEFLRPIAKESAVSTGLFFRRQPWSIERSSPLLLQWTYLIAVTFLKVRRFFTKFAKVMTSSSQSEYASTKEEMVQEATRGYEAMRHKLSLLGHSWCAADDYLRILDARVLGDMS